MHGNSLSPARQLAINGRFRREFASVDPALKQAVAGGFLLWLPALAYQAETDALKRTIYTRKNTNIAILAVKRGTSLKQQLAQSSDDADCVWGLDVGLQNLGIEPRIIRGVRPGI